MRNFWILWRNFSFGCGEGTDVYGNSGYTGGARSLNLSVVIIEVSLCEFLLEA